MVGIHQSIEKNQGTLPFLDWAFLRIFQGLNHHKTSLSKA